MLTSVPESIADTEQFLSELELALERPHTPELVALDALTPHVREIRVQLPLILPSSLIFRKGSTSSMPSPACSRRAITAPSSQQIKADDFTYRAGRLTIHLAREFGFCYGVDRAVDYAYQTRRRFPDRRGLSDRRNHPQPARQRSAAGDGRPLPQRCARRRSSASAADDVVILPAFGVTMPMLQQLERRGCTLIDTTCGSVLNVWKNVRRYAEGGYTSVIHGKVWHEETQATASQAVEYGGRYLVVFDDAEATVVCDYIRRGARPGRCARPLRERRVAGLRSRRATSSASASPIRRRC